MTTQHPDVGGAYGSSPFANGPHTDGTCGTEVNSISKESQKMGKRKWW